uniref:Uncharacterized protein n=1 Tax=Strigamia maritima TaxID=126957 RepID=T1ILD9_STRMM
MYYRKKVKEVRRITKAYVRIKLQNSTFPSAVTIRNQKLSQTYQLCRLSVGIITLSLCMFQCWKQIVYYSQTPIKVRAEITEENIGDFPAVYISATYTEESSKYDKKMEKENVHECKDGVQFYMDNHTGLYQIMKAKHFTNMIKDITFSELINLAKSLIGAN